MQVPSKCKLKLTLFTSESTWSLWTSSQPWFLCSLHVSQVRQEEEVRLKKSDCFDKVSMLQMQICRTTSRRWLWRSWPSTKFQHWWAHASEHGKCSFRKIPFLLFVASGLFFHAFLPSFGLPFLVGLAFLNLLWDWTCFEILLIDDNENKISKHSIM